MEHQVCEHCGAPRGYVICYADHRFDQQSVKITNYEDGERVAQFLADLYGSATLTDGDMTVPFARKQ